MPALILKLNQKTFQYPALIYLQDTDLKPEFRVFSYSLQTGNNMYIIDPSTGLITTKVRLDRETQAFTNITVAAIDTGTPPMTGDPFQIML